MYGTLDENDIKSLYISKKITNFYKGSKAKEAKKFYEIFDYDNKDKIQRNKYFKNYVDNYLNILEKE